MGTLWDKSGCRGSVDCREYDPRRVSTVMRFRVHVDSCAWPLSRVSTFLDARLAGETVRVQGYAFRRCCPLISFVRRRCAIAAFVRRS